MNNLMLYFIICFGGVVMGVVIISFFFNRQNSQSWPASGWLAWLRKAQAHQADSGWRIKLLSDQHSTPERTFDLRGGLAMLPIVGALGFIVGCGLLVAPSSTPQIRRLGAYLAGGGLALALLGTWLKMKFAQSGWQVATGRCVDQELREVWLARRRGKGQWIWCWRMTCEVEHLGLRYRVTPTIYEMTFPSEIAAQEFFANCVRANGDCVLRINPRNPLQAELIDLGNTKDFIR